LRWDEHFPATVNHDQMVDTVLEAAERCHMNKIKQPIPFPWSEDFGHFTARYPGALFGLGAGTDQPALHHPTYDFPDDLIETGVEIFVEIIEEMLAK
jgi:metal-dependent amidase/aminoacylase/carboxypeptidase family protein